MNDFRVLTTSELISHAKKMNELVPIHVEMLAGADEDTIDIVLGLIEKFRKSKANAFQELDRRNILV
ncbi:hypothetical protein [Paenibacillus sp. P46E]|uniref:hypothetical protein n=1 Tax=Paenibacillus sp. P46E TaxID=1349436 RepID=UPI00093DF90F|nr:hypothetical protein [Paenibacillus sp. P46E]OKP95379.1 hypothetical protein A3849_26200 [Paenibacillus sp. P46E]